MVKTVVISEDVHQALKYMALDTGRPIKKIFEREILSSEKVQAQFDELLAKDQIDPDMNDLTLPNNTEADRKWTAEKLEGESDI